MWALTTALIVGDVYGYPGGGAEPLARGGAWVARATEPIALQHNPAGLLGQAPSAAVGWDLALRDSCFTRTKAANDPTADGAASPYPRVCDDGAAIPVGYGALSLPVAPRLSLGVGLLTPSGVPRHAYPTFENSVPSPQRYLLLESTTAMAIPTLGAAYAVTSTLAIGASIGWGIAWVKTSAAAPEVIQGTIRAADVDIKSSVTATDLFVPRATLGALYRASDRVHLGASATWSDAIDAAGTLRTEANAFTPRAAGGDTSRVYHGTLEDAAHLTIALPATATLGVRIRFPNGQSNGTSDPMLDEKGDLEFDATWSGNSSIDAIQLRFPPNQHVVGAPGNLPTRADSERRYRDVVSLHAGGDYAILPRRLALRAGTFLSPRAAEPGFSGLEAMAGQRIGISAGATLRIPLSQGSFDLSVAYLHMFVADITSESDAIHAAAGQAPYRTPWPVGLGTLEDGLDVLHLGLAYRFPR